MSTALKYLYFAIGLVEVFAEATSNDMVRFFSKPLLMIVLIAFYVQAVAGKWNKVHKLIVAAFVFAWIGDVALMFVGNAGDTLMGIPKNPNFFLLGLAGFMLTHILYAFAFVQVSDKNAPALLPTRVWTIIPLFIYMAALLSVLLPAIYQNELTRPFLVPVLVYSAAIATMVLVAINRYKRVNDRSFALVFAGAMLFMFSDTLIAINKFIHSFGSSGIFIMVLYILGQYFIAKGSLAQFEGEGIGNQ
jgi:uncharacterized membrane protein YhhN